ncbi:MAG TPA: hypothetical protein PKC18_12860, partial [Lacipirellulaceae bacterium]|nr:hypothetical protein [Lacipirellulaceae bacterium]
MAAGTSPLRASHGGRLALAAAALVALWSAPAPAQDYDSIRPQINAAAAQQLMSKVTSAMRDPQVSDAGLKDIDDYFLKFFFPLMTSYRPEDLAILADNRQKLFRQFINIPRASPRAQKHLIDRTLAATRVIASGSKGNYHPAGRYNAVLILGMLDQQPGV